jgi:CHAD domain-containing protein
MQTEPTISSPHKADPITLTKRMSVEDGMRAIFANCLQHAQSNLPGVLASDDPEYLHQMRVGLRRLRSAIKLFGVTLPPEIQQELAWLGDVLGSARDCDVFLASTLPTMAADLPDGQRLEPLRKRVVALAAERRAALCWPRCGLAVASLLEWVDCRRWRDGLDERGSAWLRMPLCRFAAKAVKRGHQRIDKRANKLRRHDGEALHRLRIACKRNRYAVEFFLDLERRKRAGAYVKRLSSLQDMLGQRHDLAVALRIVHDLAVKDAQCGAAVELASAYLASRADASLGKLRKACRRVAELSPARLFQ